MIKILEPYTAQYDSPYAYGRRLINKPIYYISVYTDTEKEKWHAGPALIPLLDNGECDTPGMNECSKKLFSSFLEAATALDEQLIIAGFKLLNNWDDVDKYRMLI